MKFSVILLGLLLIITSTLGTVVYANEGDIGSTAAMDDEVYTLEEMLRYALEDEMMAQAEYEAIMYAFDITRPFSNIAKAEIKHEEAVMTLYDLYDIDIPEIDVTSHIMLPDSITMVYEIGIEAEIKNIAMYNIFLEQDLDVEVIRVFEALRDASIKHLTAFENASQSNINNENSSGNKSSQNSRTSNNEVNKNNSRGNGQSNRSSNR